MTVRKSQQRAVNKYIANNYDRINLTVPKGKKELIQSAAKSKGMSVNEFINDLVDKALQSDSGGYGISDTSDSTD